MTRYLIASLLSASSETELRSIYLKAFNELCRIRTLHLTFIPPFTTDRIDSINRILVSIAPPKLEYETAPLQMFHHKRAILYLPLTPHAPLKAYFNSLIPRIRNLVTFETTDFAQNQIPDFLPHITLNYDFNQDSLLFTPPKKITLFPPTLLEEAGPGIWQPRQL